MPKNTDLQRQKSAKRDEFRTRMESIEKELSHYELDVFKNKSVYCNCDNPDTSEFWKYFHLNFSKLELKSLTCTILSKYGNSFKSVYSGGNDNDVSCCEKTMLELNGDFRSAECLELINESDIISTNPPFSLFREYIKILLNSDKKFLIIGNMNALNYLVPHFKDGKIWYGASVHSHGLRFNVDDDYTMDADECGIDEKGNRFIMVKGTRWFTNIDYSERHRGLELTCEYDPAKYPKFDNYNAINVDKYSEIPNDYDGVMGVPISFMDYWCPEQFEILGITYSTDKNPDTEALRTNPKRRHVGIVNGKEKYPRILLKRKVEEQFAG